MPSRSEGWGGAEREPDGAKHQELFKDEQYRLIKNSSRPSIRWLSIDGHVLARSRRNALLINRYCSSLNRPPRLCFAKGTPPNSGGDWNQVSTPQKVLKRLLDVAPRPPLQFILDTRGHRPRLQTFLGQWGVLIHVI